MKRYLFSMIALLFLSFHSAFANPYLVDFDVAMGSADPYFSGFYQRLIKDLKKNRGDTWVNYWLNFSNLRLTPQAVFLLLSENYNKNKIPFVEQKKKRIPRVFHQIWVGPKPFPEKYKRWQKTWQSIPGWRYKLWTDNDVENYPLINHDAYYEEQNLGARADILRLEILYNEGGVYIDTDFECIKPEMFDILNSSYDFYAGLHPLDCKGFSLNNALIGSIPKHPILKACIERLPFVGVGSEKVLQRGPRLVSAMALEHMNKGYRDMIFPATFFYPLGVVQMKSKPYLFMLFNEETLEKVKREVVKPETLAIHWWDGSWKEPSNSSSSSISIARGSLSNP